VDVIAQMRKMVEAGETLTHVAEMMGVGVTTVSKYAGDLVRDRSRPRKPDEIKRRPRVAALRLPVEDGGFIKPPTLAQLMSGR
jgi:transposase